MRRLFIITILAAAAAATATAVVAGPEQGGSGDNEVFALGSSPSLSDKTATKTQRAAPPAFTYDRDSFLLHGEPHVLIGGQMDPQRVPRAYWADRLVRARAMGLNTIFAYVYWNLVEPSPGTWDFGDDAWGVLSNDVAAYMRAAADAGLRVVLRPGPYICGERDWGGLPWWLSTTLTTEEGEVPVRVRSSEGAFLDAARAYLVRLAEELRNLQITPENPEGPLLMVQVENEYGSYGEDHVYTATIRDILRENFDVPLYTTDGGVEWTLAGGTVPGVLASIDGDPVSGFVARDRYVTDESMLGPLLDGEYYAVWADIWGPGEAHNEATAEQTIKLLADLDFVLAANNSISLYMFHGGTNFGFGNGALRRDAGGGLATAPFTTSYDYGAPLDESGRTTPLYAAFRDAIAQYPAIAGDMIPEPPANVALLDIETFSLEPATSLFDDLSALLRQAPKRTTAGSAPPTMEALGQAYGFVLYEHRANATYEGTLQAGDRPRDRVLVYVNDARVGVLDSIYADPGTVDVTLTPGDTLRLLVENLGRVDYWSREAGGPVGLEDPYKGIRGDVTIGGEVVAGWDAYSLPLEAPPPPTQNRSLVSPIAARAGAASSGDHRDDSTVKPNRTAAAAAPSASGPPFFYRGAFEVPPTAPGNSSDPAALDTFLSMPDGVKGVVWVNGFNLGRYWTIGPQQSLYLPGVLLKGPGEGPNEVVVLELEPMGSEPLAVLGSAKRTWGSNPDPDRS